MLNLNLSHIGSTEIFSKIRIYLNANGENRNCEEPVEIECTVELVLAFWDEIQLYTRDN